MKIVHWHKEKESAKNIKNKNIKQKSAPNY